METHQIVPYCRRPTCMLLKRPLIKRERAPYSLKKKTIYREKGSHDEKKDPHKEKSPLMAKRFS